MIDCPVNTYQDEVGQSECKPCPAGYYCSVADARVDKHVCGPDGFCPHGVDVKTYCEPGFYTFETTASTDSACILCPKGKYCSTVKDATPAHELDVSVQTDCPTTFFCGEGTGPADRDIANWDPTSHVQRREYFYTHTDYASHDATCRAGYFCDVATTSEHPCEPGFSCPAGTDHGSQVACTVGNYCPGGIETPITCPAGHYCPAGTSFPIPCPLGFSNAATGQTVCVVCPDNLVIDADGDGDPIWDPTLVGYLFFNRCDARGLVEPMDDIVYYVPPGWFFDGTNVVPCEPGYFCVYPENEDVAVGQQACADGFYAPHTHHSECWPCPQGYYCPTSGTDANGDDVYTKALPCPEGHYCGAQTWDYLLLARAGSNTDAGPCPVSTYMPFEGRAFREECFECLEGYTCPDTASVEGDPVICTVGYFCP